MKLVGIVCLLAFAGCAYAKQKPHPIDPCNLQPVLSKSSATNNNKAKVTADLAALMSAFMNPGFGSEFSQTVEETSQAIPEKDVACRVMLQEVSCIVTSRRGALGNDFADSLIGIVGQKNVCADSQLQGLKQTLAGD